MRFQWKGTLYKFLEHVIMDSDTITQRHSDSDNIQKSNLQPTKNPKF